MCHPRALSCVTVYTTECTVWCPKNWSASLFADHADRKLLPTL